MSVGQFARVALVLALIAPLILWQGWPETQPSWIADRRFGAPFSAWATVGWFAVFVILSWLFANPGKGAQK